MEVGVAIGIPLFNSVVLLLAIGSGIGAENPTIGTLIATPPLGAFAELDMERDCAWTPIGKRVMTRASQNVVLSVMKIKLIYTIKP